MNPDVPYRLLEAPRAPPGSDARNLLMTLACQPQEIIENCLSYLDDQVLSELALCTYRDTHGTGPHSTALSQALVQTCSDRMRSPLAQGAAPAEQTPRPWPTRGHPTWLPLFFQRTALKQQVEALHLQKCVSEYGPQHHTVPLANTALLLAIDALQQEAPHKHSPPCLRVDLIAQRETRRQAGERALLATYYFVPWREQLPIEQLVTGTALAYLGEQLLAADLLDRALEGMSPAPKRPSRTLYGTARAYASQPKQGFFLLKHSALLLDSAALFRRYVQKLDEARDPPYSNLRETSKELGWAAMQGHVNVLEEIFKRRRTAWTQEPSVPAMLAQLDALLQRPILPNSATVVPPIGQLLRAKDLFARQASRHKVRADLPLPMLFAPRSTSEGAQILGRSQSWPTLL